MSDFNTALSKAFLSFSRGRDCRIINEALASRLGFSNAKETWEVKSEVYNENLKSVVEITLFFCFSEEFPLSIPKIYLSKKDYLEFGFLPHIDTKKQVCTFDEVSASLDPRHPSIIVEECFLKARKIIEAGLAERNQNDFEQEFLAYWENEYSKNDSVLNAGLSLIQDHNIDDCFIPIIILSKEYRGYKYCIHDSGKQYEAFKDFLKFHEINFEEDQVFFSKQVSLNTPPLNITFGGSLKLLNKSDYHKIERFLNQNKYKFVVFQKNIAGQSYYLGWQYNGIKLSQNGFRPGVITPSSAIKNFQRNNNVTRFTFENLSHSRLQLRTAGMIDDSTEKCISIAGLGSIGSHLLYFLGGLNIQEYRIIDNDFLKIENIQRHLIGFSGVKTYKCDAIKDYLLSKDPLLKVVAKNASIVSIIEEEVEIVNDSDFFFVVIGNDNVEEWIGEKLQTRIIKKPTFFIWVEPYLSAGHVIYIHPDSKAHYADFFEDRLFKNNVIHKSEYISGNPMLTKKESGCQTSFVPYSHANIILFLSAIFPDLKKLMENEDKESKSLTWIGDLEHLKTLNIKTSKLGSHNMGEIV